MKYLLIFLLLLTACSKKTDQSQRDKSKEANQSQSLKNQSNGPFELFLGVHQIEYFADRMVLKSKLSGYDFAKKTTFEKDGLTYYQVVLGPFKSQAEAEQAEKEIKDRTPDLDISKVRSIN